MNSLKETSYKILVIACTMLGIFHTTCALPMGGHAEEIREGSGKFLLVNSEAEIEEYVNRTFPEMLRSSVNPDNYLREKGHNATGMAILPYLQSHKIRDRRERRSSSTTLANKMCPVKWELNADGRRKPYIYRMAVCNTQIGLCRARHSQSACKERYDEQEVCWFRGISASTGKSYYYCEKIAIPVACSCETV